MRCRPSLVRGRAAQVNPGGFTTPARRPSVPHRTAGCGKSSLRPLMAGSSPSLPDGSNPSAAIVQSASDVQCSRLLKTTWIAMNASRHAPRPRQNLTLRLSLAVRSRQIEAYPNLMSDAMCKRCHFQKTTAPVHEAGRPVCSRLLTGSCQQSYARNSKKGGNCAELPCTTLRNGLACAMVSCAVSCNHTCNQWRAPCHQFTNQR